MQNKPNFGNDKMNINTTVTMNYVISSRWLRPKNKPNSNPIKPKTNPIKAKTNPIQTQSKPICRKGKKESFFVDKEPYDCFNKVTRGFYQPTRVSLKDKNDNVIILRITMKRGLLRIIK
jgi:hypothetical protein